MVPPPAAASLPPAHPVLAHRRFGDPRTLARLCRRRHRRRSRGQSRCRHSHQSTRKRRFPLYCRPSPHPRARNFTRPCWAAPAASCLPFAAAAPTAHVGCPAGARAPLACPRRASADCHDAAARADTAAPAAAVEPIRGLLAPLRPARGSWDISSTRHAGALRVEFVGRLSKIVVDVGVDGPCSGLLCQRRLFPRRQCWLQRQ